MARRTGPLVALAGIAALAALCVASPRFLAFFHHYANFLAVGRSSTKLAALGILAAIACVALLMRPLMAESRARKLLHGCLYALLGISLLSTLGMALLGARMGVPLNTTFYAVNDREFSFSHLTHSHLLRPVSYPAQAVVSNEVGTAWFDVLRTFFGIPRPALVAFYGAYAAFLAVLGIASLAYLQHLRGGALIALYLAGIAAVLKSGVDGAFLDLAALLGILVIGWMLRDRFLALLPVPFLVLNAYVWFTPTYGAQLAVSLMLFGCLALILAATRSRGILRLASSGAALLVALAFVWGGSRVSFFGGDAEAATPSDEPVIPAQQAVYFLPRGSGFPQRVTTTATTSPAAFVRAHDAVFENLQESLRMPDSTCREGQRQMLLTRIRIFTPAAEAAESFSVPPWIEAAYSNGYYRVTMDSCMPNLLPSLVRTVKTRFPDEVIVIAFLR